MSTSNIDSIGVQVGQVYTWHVLTVDIVDFSLRESVGEQTALVQDFIKLLNMAIPAAHNQIGKRIWSPAGDGGSLTFTTDVMAPIDTAIELARLVKKYNGDEAGELWPTFKTPSRPLRLRMGIHSGSVSMQQDFDNRLNIWGNGINMSARLITLAQPDQILISQTYYDAVSPELHHSKPHLKGIQIRRIGEGWIKHNKSMIIYNVFIEDKSIGMPFEETDVWFRPFQYPLEQAIRTYRGMLIDEYEKEGSPFRVAVLAKRILDLENYSRPSITIQGRKLEVIDIIKSISQQRFGISSGKRPFFDTLLSPLSPNALEYLFVRSVFEVFDKGSTIALENQVADRMMIIVSGEIGVYRNDHKLRVIDAKSHEEIDVVFKEGNIVGEMGIFNPNSHRNATLKAESKTIVLSLPYDLVNNRKLGVTNPREDAIRAEIRRRIWWYYCSRTKESHLSYHRLLQPLTDLEKSTLLEHAEFLPSDFQGQIPSSEDDLWNYWLFIVSGSVTVYISSGEGSNSSQDFTAGNCIGPVRLVLENNPYTGAKFGEDTQLVRIPYDIIHQITETNNEFSKLCAGEGFQERLRLKIR